MTALRRFNYLHKVENRFQHELLTRLLTTATSQRVIIMVQLPLNSKPIKKRGQWQYRDVHTIHTGQQDSWPAMNCLSFHDGYYWRKSFAMAGNAENLQIPLG